MDTGWHFYNLGKKILFKINILILKVRHIDEDLIYVNLLKKNGIKLYISNKSFYNTEQQDYKDLKVQDFIKFINNDFRAKRYRKSIKNLFEAIFNRLLFFNY